VIIPTNL